MEEAMIFLLLFVLREAASGLNSGVSMNFKNRLHVLCRSANTKSEKEKERGRKRGRGDRRVRGKRK